MTSLTDRYVSAVAAQLPADIRDEVSDELAAAIADTVDGRAGGVSESVAEHDAIRDLGHPAALAEQYRPGGPRYLVGPTAFPMWLTLVKIIVPLAAGLAALANGLIDYVAGSGVGDAIGSAVGAAWNAGVIAAVAITAFAYLAERSGSRSGPFGTGPFDPDSLPDPQKRPVKTRDEIPGIAFGLFLAVILTIGNSTVTVDGVRTEVFTDLAQSLRWIALAGVVAGLVASAVVTVTGRWTRAMATLSIAGDLAFAVPVVWLLANERLINDAVAAEISDDTTGWARAAAVGVALLTCWAIADTVRKLRRSSPTRR
ncbi:hypothetical protein [Gordonia neofelifaecis]|uniref:Uncharacterized protein n=1 Tax=Gordonia neofelifaecis NRRL B-59395 TaxID=644548 RepID=F1YPT2_9ACTN|nr:hypothetical protein [Gordonia neofelifaecis]EGD53302.1 hypothetical protein SCNU_19717 [Gordonia neofelifaecis NRRL B-59395]